MIMQAVNKINEFHYLCSINLLSCIKFEIPKGKSN